MREARFFDSPENMHTGSMTFNEENKTGNALAVAALGAVLAVISYLLGVGQLSAAPAVSNEMAGLSVMTGLYSGVGVLGRACLLFLIGALRTHFVSDDTSERAR